MNPEYWLNRWVENRIGFHRTDVNPLLERFLPEVGSATGRALVPLCGKSLDLVWLADLGYSVVGVDLSDVAAKAFAAENERHADRIEYRVGDFFDVTPENIGKFDLIYDRAALIALPPNLRPGYAEKLQSLLAPGGKILLISLEYDPAQMQGPPFQVPESEIRTIFSGLTLKKLHEHDCLEEEANFKQRGLTWMKETVYALT